VVDALHGPFREARRGALCDTSPPKSVVQHLADFENPARASVGNAANSRPLSRDGRALRTGVTGWAAEEAAQCAKRRRDSRRTWVLISIVSPYLCVTPCEVDADVGRRCPVPPYRWTDTRVVIASHGYLHLAGQTEPSSTRSAPPDTTPYVRPALPEDTTPSTQPAPRPRAPECDEEMPIEPGPKVAPPHDSPTGTDKVAPRGDGAQQPQP
jgi:hypothetical protein